MHGPAGRRCAPVTSTCCDPPTAPLDVLAQQLVAEVAAAGECVEDDLFALVRRAAPYAGLDRAVFDEVVALVSWGITTGRGRRGAHLHRDGVNGLAPAPSGRPAGRADQRGRHPRDRRLPGRPRPRRGHRRLGARGLRRRGQHRRRLPAWAPTRGGSRKVELGTVRVHRRRRRRPRPCPSGWARRRPARPSCPRRSSALRAAVEGPLAAGDRRGARALVVRAGPASATRWPTRWWPTWRPGGPPWASCRPRTAWSSSGSSTRPRGPSSSCTPPTAGRINRALGLALRKRFCVSFDFELQAAADDDTVILSLGPQHSFPLTQVPKMLSSATVADVLIQAVLPHPMLAARWRWNCNRALVVPRSRGGQRRPIHLQRMEADDLMAAAWPSLAACQENAPAGPVTVPDHVLVRQTVDDCLHEALDADGLVDLVRSLEDGRVQVHLVESSEPSPLAHGILTGRPYTFLDGAPLEERRTRAVPWAGASGAPGPAASGCRSTSWARSTPAVAEVLEPGPARPPRPRRAARPPALAGGLPAGRGVAACSRPGRRRPGRPSVAGVWSPTERPDGRRKSPTDDEAAADCLRGHLELAGPVSVGPAGGRGPLPAGRPRGAPMSPARARTALARLEAEGSAIELPDGRWCARHLLVRLHAASRARRRRHVEPASIAELVRFLARWQHVAPGTQLEGRAGLLAVIEQLQGLEIPAGDWEARCCRPGSPATTPGGSTSCAWPARWRGAGSTPAGPGAGRRARTAARGGATPSPATPLALVLRQDLPWVLAAVRVGEPAVEPTVGASADVLAVLRHRGACFRAELPSATGRLPAEVDEGLWDLVARGVATADAFSAVRSLLSARERWRSRQRHQPAGRVGLARRRAEVGTGHGEGRWSLLPADPSGGPCRPRLPGAGDRRPRWATSPSRSWPRRWPARCWPAGAW